MGNVDDYDAMEDRGYMGIDPEISERIRKSFGLEESVSQHMQTRPEGTDSRRQRALRVVDLESTFPAGRKEYVSKQELITRLKQLKDMGYEVATDSRKTTQQTWAYFNHVRRGIERGELVPKAS